MNLIVIPIDMALGWATNVIAIRMLTRPYLPTGVGPFKIQGLIPSRKAAFADGIATLIANKLLTPKDLTSILNTSKILEETTGRVADNILDHVDIPKGSRTEAKGVVLKLLDGIFKSAGWDEGHGIPSRPIDVHKIVSQKIIDMNMPEIDELLGHVAKSEFKFIERIGALVGLVIGLIQVLVL